MATKAYPAIKWLASQWDHKISTARTSGIVGDRAHAAGGGYHLSRQDNYSSNYSVAQFAADRRGPSNAAAAIDMTMNRASMILVSKRLVRAMKAKDPRIMRYVRAFNGTVTGNRAIRVEAKEYASSGGRHGVYSTTGDHLWHVHLEIYRQYANDMTAMRAILSVILGAKLVVAKPAPRIPIKDQPRVTYGVHHNAVKVLQIALNKIYNVGLATTGEFNASTLRYVNRFQKQYKLPISKTVERKTWQYISLAYAGKNPLYPTIDSQAIINYGVHHYSALVLQRSLNKIYKLHLVPTGVFDAKTLPFVNKFQKEHGLPESKTVTREMWVALAKAYAAAK